MGLDAKWVMQRGPTLDLTLNPDFSLLESDEPQITTNQRYEIYFPEKRPFFTEKRVLFSDSCSALLLAQNCEPNHGCKAYR